MWHRSNASTGGGARITPEGEPRRPPAHADPANMIKPRSSCSLLVGDLVTGVKVVFLQLTGDAVTFFFTSEVSVKQKKGVSGGLRDREIFTPSLQLV
jgi:hypothetical protein